MSKQTQRVKDMVDGYVDLWKQGHTLTEIASFYHVTSVTAYRYLQQIADKSGYTREQLLEVPARSGPRETTVSPLKRESVDAEQLKAEFCNAKSSIETLINKLNDMEVKLS